MARGAGIALKSLQWLLRAIEFLCAATVLVIFSYFLAKLSENGLGINNYWRAVEGISGAAVLYTLIALVFLWCLGGLTLFAIAAILLDLAFVGGFIFIAYETRHGANSCSGTVQTPLGTGDSGAYRANSSFPTYGTSCRMNTAAFAVSIVAIVFFLLSALVEVALWRHHRAEKKYGPGPDNNYTSGYGKRRFWQKKNNHHAAEAGLAAGGIAAEKHHHDHHHAGNYNGEALPANTNAADVRQSYNTENTMVGNEIPASKYLHNNNDGFATTGTTGTTGNYVSPAARYDAPATGYTAESYNNVSSEVPATRY